MSIPARISLSQTAPAFRPEPGRVYRISLAWWDPDEPEGRREPVLVASRFGVARTLVVVWPTDVQGYIDLARAQRGEVEVLPWDLTAEDRERTAARARGWPLDRHDLLVWVGGIAPCPETLMVSDLGRGLKGRIEAAIAGISE